MSNLCSEILQVSTPSVFNEDLSYAKVGKDISCNLGSMNIAKTMDSPDFAQTIEVAIRALTAVSDQTHICVGAVDRAGQQRLARDRPRPDEPARLPGARADLLRLRRGHGLHQHLLLHGAVSTRCGRRTASRSSAARTSRASRTRSTRRASSSTSTPSRCGSRRPTRCAQLFADADIRIPTQEDWRQAQGVGAEARHLQPEPAGRAADRVDLLHQPLDVLDPPGGVARSRSARKARSAASTTRRRT